MPESVESDADYYLRRARDFVEEYGEPPPPWARFPEFSPYDIRWRMGDGEDWKWLWTFWLNSQPRDLEWRSGYLKRHPPAPWTCLGEVYQVLYPDCEESYPELVTERWIVESGLVASDAAFRAWMSNSADRPWPWEWLGSPSASLVALYMREVWFSGRRLRLMRDQDSWEPPRLPLSWSCYKTAVRSGEGRRRWYDSVWSYMLRQMLAGRVTPPWELGLRPRPIRRHLEFGEGSYIEAFHAWAVGANDDSETLHRTIGRPPPAWHDWYRTHIDGPLSGLRDGP